MKKYLIEEDVMFVGTVEEIAPVYKAIKRASYKTRNCTRLVPKYDTSPMYNLDRLYGLYIEEDTGWVSVVNEHVALSLIVDGRAAAA